MLKFNILAHFIRSFLSLACSVPYRHIFSLCKIHKYSNFYNTPLLQSGTLVAAATFDCLISPQWLRTLQRRILKRGIYTKCHKHHLDTLQDQQGRSPRSASDKKPSSDFSSLKRQSHHRSSWAEAAPWALFSLMGFLIFLSLILSTFYFSVQIFFFFLWLCLCTEGLENRCFL